MKIAVLGASGMLGSMLVKYLSQHYQVVDTVRQDLDAMTCEEDDITQVIADSPWVINAIGLIKQKMQPNDGYTAMMVNSRLPMLLARAAKKTGSHVIQIATDCVYAGSQGNYTESACHAFSDLYSRTKSWGEVESPNMHHLRCSIVGLSGNTYDLLGWFLSQPKGARVRGYTNHLWNGITTLQFAQICHGIIQWGVQLPHLQHIVPDGYCSKGMLLSYFGEYFGRNDIIIIPEPAPIAINRVLTTDNIFMNDCLWRMAGYKEIPTIEQMIKELAEYEGYDLTRHKAGDHTVKSSYSQAR